MHHFFDEVEEAGRLLEQTDLVELMKAPQIVVIGVSNLCAMIAVANLRIKRNVKFHRRMVLRMKKCCRQWAISCP